MRSKSNFLSQIVKTWLSVTSLGDFVHFASHVERRGGHRKSKEVKAIEILYPLLAYL